MGLREWIEEATAVKLKLVLVGLGYTLLVGLLAAGCGSSGGAANAPSGNTTEKTKAAAGQVIKKIQVKETEFKLGPSNINLNKAGTYVFVADNAGGVSHALEIEGNGIEEETENLSPGQSAELRVNLKPGTYEIYCPVDGHKEQGMEGKITVKQGSQGGSGGGGY